MSFEKIWTKMLHSFKHCKSLLLNFLILHSAPWRFELIKEIGTSSRSSLFWVRMAAYEVSEAKVYKMNYFSKLGHLNAGASTMACLVLLKAYFISWFHLNTISFLITACKGLIIFYKSKDQYTNKIYFLQERLTIFLVVRICNCYNRFSSIKINNNSFLTYKISQNISFRHCKYVFLWIQWDSILTTPFKNLSQVQKVITRLLRKNHYVTQIYHHWLID